MEVIYVNPTEGQIKKIARALKKGEAYTIRLSRNRLEGEIPIYVTPTMKRRLEKARRNNKGLDIKVSKSLSKKSNKEVEGGILPALLPLLATAATGLLSGVAGGVGTLAVNKIDEALSGDGLQFNTGDGYKKKGMGLFPLGVKP